MKILAAPARPSSRHPGISPRLQKTTPPPAPAASIDSPPYCAAETAAGVCHLHLCQKFRATRVLALDPDGNLLVSLTHQGKVVALPDKDGDGVADAVVTVLEGLNKPHGLAFGPGNKPRLYVAETDRVAAYRL